MPRVEVHDGRDALHARLAAIIGDAATRGPVALSGGATPMPAYRIVADSRVSGSWFQVDERIVPFGHAASNASAIEACGLTLHRIDTDGPPSESAAAYERALRASAPLSLAVLGIGADGHVASLFPGAPEVEEERAWVVATRGEHAGHRRITMTLPVLDLAAERLIVAAGQSKRAVLRLVLSGAAGVPAARVRDPLWLLDREAAEGLS